MAKARRTVHKRELPDGSAVIDLNTPAPADTGASKLLPDYGAKPPGLTGRDAGASGADGGAVEINRTTLPPPPAEIVEPQVPDLESQVRALKKREEAARSRSDEDRKARIAAENARVQSEWKGRGELEVSQHSEVANALAARQAALETTKASIVQARVANDPIAEVEATSNMQRINADIAELERGKVAIERNLQVRKTQQPQLQPAEGADIENVLSRLPALNNEERDWIRKHPETITDPKQVMIMQGAYQEAERKAIKRGSPEYFKLFEDRLGLEADAGNEPEYDDEEYDMIDEPNPPPARPEPRQRPQASAPPSRTAPGVSSPQADMTGGRVTLNPQQREAARIAGIDETTYAKGVLRLNKLKKSGYYQETG